jgi:DNA-binding NarL/FixJ family response regulator
MHVEQDRAVRSGAASYSAPLVLDEYEVPAAAITVMIASGRKALHAAWFSMLASESGIEIKGGPVMDATCLATCVERQLPKVLLLDKALLDVLDSRSLRRIHAQRQHVRVLLLWDEICQDLVADVLRNGFNGFLPTTSLPEVCLKAIRAVSEGELWLSRASLATAIVDLLGLSDPGDAGASGDGLRVGAAEALTPRELQVVALLRRGCINKEIAQELGIMEDTVKKHLQSVFAKLGVHRRALVALRPLPGYGLAHSIP